MCQPTFDPPGGTNAVAAWMLQALLSDDSIDDVEVFCFRAPDLDAIDAYFGTGLSALRRAQVTVVPQAITSSLDLLPVPAWLLRQTVFLKLARRHRRPDQLAISCCNELPVHAGCISYVHYPAQLRPRPLADRRWYHWTPLLRAYYGVVDSLHGDPLDPLVTPLGTRFSTAAPPQRLLCNARWTMACTRAAHPRASLDVVYPPVRPIKPDVDARRRDDPGKRFIAVGRLSPEKRFEDAIAIVAGLRRVGHGATLHIVAADDHSAYGARIHRLAAASGCTTLSPALDRRAYEVALSSSSFGLSTMHEEHFGIAVADMVDAGVVPFVHRSGGTPEITQEDALLFDDVDDAVARIDAVLHNDELERALRDRLWGRRGRFSPAIFMAQIQREVREGLAGS